MIYNYRSLDDIVKKNQGKLATFAITSKAKSPEDQSYFLSFCEGDRIRFYHYQDIYKSIETSLIAEFAGLVERIELKEEYYQWNNSIKTEFFINSILSATWTVYGDFHFYEPIDWELTKNK